MCGIIGSFPAAALHLDYLVHRGPDGGGTVVLPAVSFGHTRLAILDLTERAAQPKWSSDGNVLLTYNGEIYNYKTLGVREEHSDTVALVEWLSREGPHFDASLLDGMYAFAAYFVKERRLVLCRDPVGIKPLYLAIAEDGSQLAFASEIKGFFGVEWFRARPNMDESVQREFLQNGCGMPQPTPIAFRGFHPVLRLVPTLLDGVYQMSPGQTLVLAMDAEPREQPTSLVRASQDVFEALAESVQEQSMSDVEVGVQLSGGIDSSLVAYHYALKHRAVHGFFVSVDYARLSEAPWAEMACEVLSKICQFQFHRIPVTQEEVRRVLPSVMWYMDEPPIRYPNSVGLYLLCEYVRQRTKVEVLLTGEGADEMFGGYPWHDGRTVKDFDRPRRLFDLGLPSACHPPPPPGSQREGRGLLDRLWPASLRRPAASIVEWQLLCDRMTYLPPILARQDRMSMAHSIESRVPFLANRFLQLPPPALPGKRLLKKKAAKIFGRRFARRRKCGFTFPFAWMGGTDGISQEHLGWLRGSWKPADAWQCWALTCLSQWSRYYLFDGWKSMT